VQKREAPIPWWSSRDDRLFLGRGQKSLVLITVAVSKLRNLDCYVGDRDGGIGRCIEIRCCIHSLDGTGN
jgi:hypothetical protein